MKLDYVEIVNFRSVKESKIKFSPNCKVLVGINESGKSNILRALFTMSDEYEYSNEDVREPLPNETMTEDSYVDFVFDLDTTEKAKIFKLMKSKVLTKNYKTPLLQKVKKDINLEEFCDSKNSGIYRVDVKEESSYAQHWALTNEYSVLENWKKPSEACPAEYSIEQSSENIFPKNFCLINTDEYKNIPAEYLTNITSKDINNAVGKEVAKLIKENLPEIIFWRYEEKYLLPPSINLNEFITNPESCIPLKNMFLLCGVTDIQEAVENARQGHKSALANLLNRVAKHSTGHFRKVWKEYNSIKFDLSLNGELVDIGVREVNGREDGNKYQLSLRSDGFKRFVNFLLFISTRFQSSQLKNTLLLVDEPDISLHPSGARYLRDELIKISKDNFVIYSTHSIFMIDKENIGRHYIVKKEKEVTRANEVNVSNIVDEEVLYNAMGSSIAEILKEKNIIFEGWRDKLLFNVAISNVPNKYKNIKVLLKNIGTCHAEGVKDIRHITPIIELARKHCVIISDSDKPALEKQAEYKKIKGYGIWKTYNDLQSDVDAVTSEDFIKSEAFVKSVKKIKEKLQISSDPDLSDSKGKIYALKKWMSRENVSESNCKEMIENVKEEIFNNLKQSDIEENYYKLLDSLSTFILR